MARETSPFPSVSVPNFLCKNKNKFPEYCTKARRHSPEMLFGSPIKPNIS